MYSCFKTLFNAGCLNILLLYLFTYLVMIKLGEGEEKIMTNGDMAEEKNNKQNRS